LDRDWIKGEMLELYKKRYRIGWWSDAVLIVCLDDMTGELVLNWFD